MCVNNLPMVAFDGGAAAGIWTWDLLIASPASHHYATEPHLLLLWLALLRVRSATGCQQPPEWSVLGQVNCISPWQPVGVEVVLHRLHPRHPRSSLPHLGGGKNWGLFLAEVKIRFADACSMFVQRCSIANCWRCSLWAWSIKRPTSRWLCHVAFYHS